MDQFGGRCYHDCTIVSPTFEERHDLYWELVKKYQDAAKQEDSSHEPPAHSTDWVARINQSLSFGKRMVFRMMLHHTHQAIRFREKSRIIRSLLFGEIRQIVRQIGNRLVEKGHLQQSDDVFYLRWNELEEIVYGKFQFPETIPQLILLRQEAHKNNEEIEPPSLFLRELGGYYQAHESPAAYPAHSDSQSQLVGIAVSGGRVKGRARIIIDPVRDQRLQPGDILVTKSTDPGWTPLFKIAGGLILEKGGMLSHGAIVAREFGIPAITAVERATTLITDGDILIINGDTGEIEWIERVSETAAV